MNVKERPSVCHRFFAYSCLGSNDNQPDLAMVKLMRTTLA